MDIAYTLCNGHLVSVSPMYVIIVSVIILSFVTGLILTYRERTSTKVVKKRRKKKAAVSSINVAEDIINNNISVATPSVGVLPSSVNVTHSGISINDDEIEKLQEEVEDFGESDIKITYIE